MKDLYIRVKYLDKETGKVRCYTKTLKKHVSFKGAWYLWYANMERSSPSY